MSGGSTRRGLEFSTDLPIRHRFLEAYHEDMVQLETISAEHLWYTVGLIATDGNLSPSRRHINITSKDRDHLSALRTILGLHVRIGRKGNGSSKEKLYSVLQFGDVRFYKFLLSIGLTPRKSLTMGVIKVPQKQFKHFLRGIVDGDGHITTWIHPTNQHRQWALGFTSAAPVFIQWLKSTIEREYGVQGRLHVRYMPLRNPLYKLKFGKLAAKVILQNIYRPEYFCLQRKLQRSIECLQDESRMINYGNVIARVA